MKASWKFIMPRFKRRSDEMSLMRTKMCDACGRQRPINGFGDGTKLPKGTCIACGDRIKAETEQRKIELKKIG